MPSFVLPSPGPAGQPYQFAVMPANGATPSKLILKNTTAAYVYDGSSLTKITDADYPALTVYGVVVLDGTVYVMNSAGTVFGSDLLDPLSWSALNFVSANSQGDVGVALVRHLNYIIAFKQQSTEFLYDAGNPVPGSPLGKMVNSFLEVGCSSSGSIAFTDNTVVFMSNAQQKGRSISVMEGFTPVIISTPFVDRILNADDLAGVYAYVVKSNGHVFYVLTLTTSAVTLVYDFVTKEWHEWTTLTASAAQNGTATVVDSQTSQIVTSSAHGLANFQLISVGAVKAIANVIDSVTFQITLDTPVFGAVSFTPYAESNFPASFYTRGANVDYLLTVSGGNVLQLDPTTYQDQGNPIYMKVRTKVEDWGTLTRKMMRKMEVVGDQVTTKLWISYSDDDYQTFNYHRPINLNNGKERLMAGGTTFRRAYDLRNFDNVPLRLIALEVDFDIGSR